MDIRISIDDRIVTAITSVKSVLTRTRLATIVGVSTLAAVGLVSAEPIDKPYDFEEGTPAVAAEINANFDRLYDALNDHVVRASTVIHVALADGCAGITAAIVDLAERHILPAARVTIQLEAGTYACGSSTLYIQNLYWPQVSLVGAGNGTGGTTLSFTGDTHGIQVSRSVFGTISDMSVTGAAMEGYGVYIIDSSAVALDTVSVSGFSDGIMTARSSRAQITASVSSGNGRCGFVVGSSSSMVLRGGSVADGNVVGVFAFGASSVDLSDGVTLRGGGYGAQLETNSVMYASDTTITGATSVGVLATLGGFAHLYATDTISNTPTALHVASGGRLRADSAMDTSTAVSQLSNITENALADDGSYVEIF